MRSVCLSILARVHVAVEQLADLGFPEPAVAPGRPDALELTRGSPASDRLRVDAEERGYFPGREQALTVTVHRCHPWSLAPWSMVLGQVSQNPVNCATNMGNRLFIHSIREI